MNKLNISLICATLLTALLTACSENSTSSEPEYVFDASVVCPAEGLNAYGEPNRGTFIDERDGQEYKYTTIGNQVWMAENLKFEAPYSIYYDKIEGYSDTFGRFYSLIKNGERLGLFDQELMDTICPAGWHVPSADEWRVLSFNVGDDGSKLTSPENYGENYQPGTNDCAFNSLPAGVLWGGHYVGDTGYTLADNFFAYYWTSTARNSATAYMSLVPSTNRIAYRMHEYRVPIRCLKD